MLRAQLNGLFIIGLEAENVKRLKDGKPIVFSLAQMGGPDADVVIMYGETLADILAELEKASGKQLPPNTPLRRDD